MSTILQESTLLQDLSETLSSKMKKVQHHRSDAKPACDGSMFGNWPSVSKCTEIES